MNLRVRKMKGAMLPVVLCGAFLAAPATQAREFAEIYIECGLGAMISPKNDAVAVVTNVTWDLGTTAISSNVSSPDSCQGGKEKMAAFIFKTYPQLETQIAQGKGKYLDQLVNLSGVGEKKSEFVSKLRKEFAAVIAQQGEASQFEKSSALYQISIKLSS